MYIGLVSSEPCTLLLENKTSSVYYFTLELLIKIKPQNGTLIVWKNIIKLIVLLFYFRYMYTKETKVKTNSVFSFESLTIAHLVAYKLSMKH